MNIFLNTAETESVTQKIDIVLIMKQYIASSILWTRHWCIGIETQQINELMSQNHDIKKTEKYDAVPYDGYEDKQHYVTN